MEKSSLAVVKRVALPEWIKSRCSKITATAVKDLQAYNASLKTPEAATGVVRPIQLEQLVVHVNNLALVVQELVTKLP